MGISPIISCPLASTGVAIVEEWVVSSSVALPFNPIKLGLLVLWVYLCMYVVQYIQFSSLVPQNQKMIASIIALFMGPLLLLAIVLLSFIITLLKVADKTVDKNTIKDRVQDAIANLKSVQFTRKKYHSITLMDSSGRDLSKIYKHGRNQQNESYVLKLSRHIISDALEQRASDILIDPKDETTFIVRFRVDGVLRQIEAIETDVCKALINSIKAVSKMDISEKRRPQDGSFIAKTAEGTVSFRAASAGVHNGEKLSIRVLNQNAGVFALENIGLSSKQRKIIEDALNRPSGMIIMTGPTGSGKTTTLYAILNKIDLFTRNVITVEDPIEYILPNASQIEVNPKADITFAKALRSILRQDPDVICIGEIRDEETAGIALRSAQTGHLVLATIHASSNATSLVRLLDLDISPTLLASGLELIISQRLLRRLCKKCKIPAKLTMAQKRDFEKKKINYANMFQPRGCKFCHGTGYRGRIAVFDILLLDDKMKSHIANNPNFIMQMREDGEKKGKSNLQKQGLKAVVSGVTTLEELKRVIG